MAAARNFDAFNTSFFELLLGYLDLVELSNVHIFDESIQRGGGSLSSQSVGQ